MSLIQEALRRQEAEHGSKGGPTKAAPPPPPATPRNPHTAAEPPKLEPRRKQGEKAWLALTIIALVVFSLAALGTFFIQHGWTMLDRWLSQDEQPPAPVAEKKQPVEQAPAEAKPGVVDNPQTAVGKTVAKIKQVSQIAEQQAALADAAVEAAAAPAPVVPVPEMPAPEIARPPAPAPVPVVTPAPPPQKKPAAKPPAKQALPQAPSIPAVTASGVQWPPLSLTGIMLKSDARRSAAVINKMILGRGDYVDGVRIVEVQEYGVLLEFQGEQRFLPVGNKNMAPQPQ